MAEQDQNNPTEKALTEQEEKDLLDKVREKYLLVEEYKINIDWAWSNFGAPREERCKDPQVSPGVTRQNKSAHDCVVMCIDAHIRNQFVEALGWLLVTQCHNDNARMSIAVAGGAAITYAVTTYGS
ncbi:MAG TPA: hypothetical protein VFW07_22645 [Parafilimonas sp.]|nr:hypothetical protein [Parafilimonas sp.]